jgi:hypothetical protein
MNLNFWHFTKMAIFFQRLAYHLKWNHQFGGGGRTMVDKGNPLPNLFIHQHHTTRRPW